MRAYQFISEKAVSKKQQQFFGIVRAMQKGDMPKSGEAGEVAKDMKKSDVKDFAKTKHKGLPTKKTSEEAAGVGIVTKQNATADVPVGGEYMNVKKLFPKKKKKKYLMQSLKLKKKYSRKVSGNYLARCVEKNNYIGTKYTKILILY